MANMSSPALLLTVCLAVCSSRLAQASAHLGKHRYEMQDGWTAFKAQHGRNYDSQAAEAMRMRIYLENRERVELFNEQLSESAGFKLGLNHMSDWTEAELDSLKGFKLTPASANSSMNSQEAERFLQNILDDSSPVPDEVDWRKEANRVSRVKDQGICVSGWAFAATGVLEGQQVVRKSGSQLVELSEQNLVDCATKGVGCGGGRVEDALNSIRSLGGIEAEASYPYEAKSGKCRFNKSEAVMTDAGATFLPSGDEEALKRVVAEFGPVAVAIDASSPKFVQYRGGYYSDPYCSNEASKLDHGVLVVGYGTNSRHGDFWIVKNSWSESWGEKGYIRMKRNKKNECGIATRAIIPTF